VHPRFVKWHLFMTDRCHTNCFFPNDVEAACAKVTGRIYTQSLLDKIKRDRTPGKIEIFCFTVNSVSILRLEIHQFRNIRTEDDPGLQRLLFVLVCCPSVSFTGVPRGGLEAGVGFKPYCIFSFFFRNVYIQKRYYY